MMVIGSIGSDQLNTEQDGLDMSSVLSGKSFTL